MEIDRTPWEKRTSTTKDMVEEFTLLWNDLSIGVTQITDHFHISYGTAVAVARRLGLAERVKKLQPRVNVGSSLASIEAKMAELHEQMEALQQQKDDLVVRVVRHEDELQIFGLGSTPIVRKVYEVVDWLKAQGPMKLREKIHQEEWER